MSSKCDYVGCQEDAEYARRKHHLRPNDKNYCEKHIREFWQLIEGVYASYLLAKVILIVTLAGLKSLIFDAPEALKKKLKGEKPLEYFLIDGEVEEL